MIFFDQMKKILVFSSVFHLLIVILQARIEGKEHVMARPIKETPILTGEDAEAFMEEMEKVDNLSEETRTANRVKLLEEFQTIIKKIAVCL